MSIKLATIVPAGGKLVVKDGEGNLVHTFDPKEALKAIEAKDALDRAAIAAADQARAAETRIELLSKDGQPVNGIPTVKAGDRVVYKTSKAKGGKPAGSPVTELDLCEIAGYVLVRRNGAGNVLSEFVPGPDLNRYVPLSPTGIAALSAIFSAAKG